MRSTMAAYNPVNQELIYFAGSGRCRPLFRNDVAQPLRFDVAQRSEMISPSNPG
jgi:hypothetical protein